MSGTTSCMYLLHLPHDVLRHIQPYCSCQQWRKLMDTSSTLQLLRKETQILHFTVYYSQLYATNTNGFRDYVASELVKQPKKQISLRLSANQPLTTLLIDFDALLIHLTCQTVKTIMIQAHLSGLVLKYCTSLESLIIEESCGGVVEDLQVLESPKTNLIFKQSTDNASNPSLITTKTCTRLSLQDCPFVLSSIYQFAALKTLSLSGHRVTQDLLEVVQHVPHLSLHFCSQLEDISMLGQSNQYLSFLGCSHIRQFPTSVSRQLKTFCISENAHISDLTIFRTLTSITLQECPNITDVTPLEELQYVDLTCCDGVSDVTALNKVRKLILHSCTNVTDVSALSHVMHLNLADMPQLTHISMLDHVRCLEINDSVNICSIGASHCLRMLHMENLPPLTILPYLPNVTKLRITEQTIESFTSTFPSLREGFFMRCELLDDINTLKYLQRLTLVDCTSVDYSLLRGIPTIALINSPISDLTPLQDCTEVFLGNCAEVTDVQALSRADKVRLIYCANVSDVSPLKAVCELHIIGCPAITDLSQLVDVRILHISICQGVKDISMLSTVGTIYLLSTKNSMKGGDSLQNIAIED